MQMNQSCVASRVKSGDEKLKERGMYRTLYRMGLHIRAYGLIRGLQTFVKRVLAKGTYQIVTPNGGRHVFLRAGTSDESVFDQVFLREEYRQVLRKAPDGGVRTIIDCGANIGLTAVYLAERFPSARIVSIEPEQSNFELLMRNIDGLSSVTAIRAAVWPKDQRVKIDNLDARHWSFRVSESSAPGAGEIEGISPEALMERFGLDRVSIFKADIEGAERELFAGRPEWVRRVDLFVLEFHERYAPGCSMAFYSALHELPFEQYIDGENVFVYATGNQQAA